MARHKGRCVCGVTDKAHARKSRRNQLPRPKPVNINAARRRAAKARLENDNG